MEPEFWLSKWQEGQTGFHLDRVNPLLQKYLPVLDLSASGHVLLPLCGKSVDLQYLHALGHSVTGIELSPLAIQSFWETSGMTPELAMDQTGTRRWTSGTLVLLEGDIFQITPETVGIVDAVYDRAALIAMPPHLRPAYVQKLKILANGAPILLITLSYPEDEMQGPPFSVREDEIMTLFAPEYQAELLETSEVIDHNEGLRRRGLTQLRETVWLLTSDRLA